MDMVEQGLSYHENLLAFDSQYTLELEMQPLLLADRVHRDNVCARATGRGHE